MSRNATTDMIEDLRGNEVLVRRDTLLPETVKREDQLVMAEWNIVSHLATAETEKRLNQAGWHFFYLPPEVRASAIGFNRRRVIASAVRKLLEKANSGQLNIVQITGLDEKELLGIHYARVSAYLRHIQKGPILFQAAEDVRQRELARAA